MMMLSFTSYTKYGIRIATIIGLILSVISFIVAIVYFVLKLIHWDWFVGGAAATVIGLFFFDGFILFFLGLMGEYVLTMNARLMNRPLVIEEERINLPSQEGRANCGK